MCISRRLRLSLLSMVVLVALVALLLGWAAERRRRLIAESIAALTAQHQQLEARLRWTERMSNMNYLPRAAVTDRQHKLEQVDSQLRELSDPLHRPSTAFQISPSHCNG